MKKSFTLFSTFLSLFLTLNNVVLASPIQVSVNTQNSYCAGSCSGAATAIVTGAVGQVIYNWSGPGIQGLTAQNVSNICPGAYSVSVMDLFDSTVVSANFNISQPPSLFSNINSQTNVTCAGGTDGSISVSASGGVPPYTYNWSPITSFTSTVNGIYAGNYTCTITDANGCTTSQSVTITEPAAIIVNAGPDIYKCSYDTVILATAVVGGTGTYTYSWGPITSDLSSTTSNSPYTYTPGTTLYIVSVTDGNGCFASDDVSVIVYPEMFLSLSPTSPTICGGSDGTISLTVTGGTPAYAFNWNNGQTSTNALGLSGNATYSVIVTDQNGCTKSDSTYVSEPNSLSGETNSLGSDCNDENGSIITYVGGGVAPYTYVWSNGATTQDIYGLNSGLYSVQITDSINCQLSLYGEIMMQSMKPSIEGTVNYLGAPMTEGFVYLYRVFDQGAFQQVDSFFVTSNGTFSFNNVQARPYLLKAVPGASYPNAIATYFSSTTQWSSADTLFTSCDSTYTGKNIDIIELPPLAGGTGTIGGQILDITGSFKRLVQGDPLPGVDVSLEQNPGSVLRAQTTTDTTGNYIFENVPDGDYTIYVDIPGLDMLASYDISIAPGSDSFTSNVFYVDSTGTIDTIAPIISMVKKTVRVFENGNVKVFPNPFKDFVNIEYSLSENASIQLEVFNLIGEKVAVLENTLRSAGEYRNRFSAREYGLGSGVYFLRITQNSETQNIKIVLDNL